MRNNILGLQHHKYNYALYLKKVYPMFYSPISIGLAFLDAIETNDVQAFKMLFDLYIRHERVLALNCYLMYSICHQSDAIYSTLLDVIKPYATKDHIKQITREIAQVARIDYFDLVVSKYGNLITEGDSIFYTSDYIDKDDLLSPLKYSEYLKYIISIPTHRIYKSSEYWNRYISKEESLVLVEFDNVILDNISRYADPEAALVFYLSDRASEIAKATAFEIITHNTTALDQLLVKNIPVKHVVEYVRDDLLLLHIIQHISFTTSDLLTLLSYALNNEYLDSIRYITTSSSIIPNPHHIERLIITQSIPVSKKLLYFIVQLGVSLDVIGEVLAFRGNRQTLKFLKSLGYSFIGIEHDLMIHSLLSSKNYRNIPFDQFVEEIANNNLTKAVDILTSQEVELYIHDYSWIHYLTPDMLQNYIIKRLLQLLSNNKAKQILRRGTLSKTDSDLLTWLQLSTGLGQGVNMCLSNNNITYVYNNMSVIINNDIGNSKYAGLDMFSSIGQPLTTREQIKARRLELLPKVA
jgi:hypothetical protein